MYRLVATDPATQVVKFVVPFERENDAEEVAAAVTDHMKLNTIVYELLSFRNLHEFFA